MNDEPSDFEPGLFVQAGLKALLSESSAFLFEGLGGVELRLGQYFYFDGHIIFLQGATIGYGGDIGWIVEINEEFNIETIFGLNQFYDFYFFVFEIGVSFN